MKIEVEIDETQHGFIALTPETCTQLFKTLNELYQKIWVESCYDPYNQETKTLCQKLLADIETVNAILKFKK